MAFWQKGYRARVLWVVHKNRFIIIQNIVPKWNSKFMCIDFIVYVTYSLFSLKIHNIRRREVGNSYCTIHT